MIIALLRGWVVTAARFEDLRKDRDEWKEIALRSTDLSVRAVTLVDRRSTTTP
jgi:hypothetical protein